MSSHRSRQRQIGKKGRKQAPRSSHGNWVPASDRPDPIDLLQQQDKGRLQRLIPIKYGRMLESPFAFLRGSAVVMASDLASTPDTGIDTMICGDAHISNFGLFATPERKLVFDINDFDEAYFGPWEWDLKRLVASVVVAGRGNGYSDKACRRMTRKVISVYKSAMDRFSSASTLDMWYHHVDAEAVQNVFDRTSSKQGSMDAEKMIAKARSKTQRQTLAKLTTIESGLRRIIANPPLVVPFRDELFEKEIASEEAARQLAQKAIEDAWSQYLDSLSDERRFLLQRYHITDGALRVGGVGSVGTRCLILLLEARDADDAIILQLKEASPSILETYHPRKAQRAPAERVVVSQRLMQASSDMFLGWHQDNQTYRNYYWRQLKDMKGSANIEKMDTEDFGAYINLCTWCLARAHARTGDSSAITGYIGRNDTFAKAMTKFAITYADQTERDYDSLVGAVKSGRIIAETGI